MLDPKTQTQEDELWNEASNPTEKSYDFFGKVEARVWECGFEKGVRGGVPYDPTRHEKRHLMVDMFIQPLPEIDVKYPLSLEFHDVTWSRPYIKILWPSLKTLGLNNLREVNGRWAQVARVPNGKTYFNSQGEEKEETTFKFVQFFADEDECRAAYVAAGGAPANNNGSVPTQPAATGNTEKDTAYAFLKVIVQNAARGKASVEEAQVAVATALTQYPTVSKFYTAESAETVDLINQAIPPF